MSGNGHASSAELFQRLFELEHEHQIELNDRAAFDARSSYYAGEVDRMNPIPRGVNPYGANADTHYASEQQYFLTVERGRAAVRNHPLVETAINRLASNLRLDSVTLDVNSGDASVDADQKADWQAFIGETQAGRNFCDYEGERCFGEISRQSFFNQVVDGDIVHVPLFDGSLQTFENHHLRNPFGHRSSIGEDGFVHGVEIRGGKPVALHLTPNYANPYQSLPQKSKSRRYPIFDVDGNRIAFHLGFKHRFSMRRGISRLSPPQPAMNGFHDSNYAHIKSMLKRALLSYWMESQESGPRHPGAGGNQSGGTPKAGDRYTTQHGLGLESIVVEEAGQPAQVWNLPEGKKLVGVNDMTPSPQWFEHASLMLTILSVNIDLPLMFLLLDGSKVNFHGGRMITDQIRLRYGELQKQQIGGLWNPMYEMRTRQRLTPGHPLFARSFANAVRKGKANPFLYQMRPLGWPYVKPLEDAAAEDLAEKRNLKSLRRILSARGVDYDDHRDEVIPDRASWLARGFEEAIAFQKRFSEFVSVDDIGVLAREFAYGNQTGGVQLAITGAIGESENTKETNSTNGESD